MGRTFTLVVLIAASLLSQEEASQPDCARDEFLIRFKDWESAELVTSEIVASLPDVEIEVFDVFALPENRKGDGAPLPLIRRFKLKAAAASRPPEAFEICDDARLKAGVRWAEPVAYGRLLGEPADPLYWEKGNLAPGVYDQWALRDINCPLAWPRSEGASDIVVAVLDSGLDYEHEDIRNDGKGPLRDRIWVNSKEDRLPEDPLAGEGDGILTEADLDGTPDNEPVCIDGGGPCVKDLWQDDVHGIWPLAPGPKQHWDIRDPDGHGTFVAGIIGARSETDPGVAIGMAGMDWRCKIMPIRVTPLDFSLPKTNGTFEGLHYAREFKASIANCSWQYPVKLDCVAEAIASLHASNIAIVVAANDKRYDPAFDYPAGDNRVIVVGASTMANEVWRLSGRGSKLDLLAPGERILSLRASCCRGPAHPKNDKYAFGDGTSFATPLVSGACALFKANTRIDDNERIRQALRISAETSIGGPGWDMDSGYGKLDVASLMDQEDACAAHILEPAHRSVIEPGASVEVKGRAFGEGTVRRSLWYGEGESPAAWTQIGTYQEDPVSSPDGTIDPDWHAGDLPMGTYTLRLLVEKGEKGYEYRSVFKRFYGPPAKSKWPANCGSSPYYASHGSLKCADLDGNGSKELLCVPGRQPYLQVFNRDGTSRWQHRELMTIRGNVAVGDVDRTLPGCEIFYCSYTYTEADDNRRQLSVHCMRSNGEEYPFWDEWPRSFLFECVPENGGPILADLDGDGLLDSVILLTGMSGLTPLNDLRAPTTVRAMTPYGKDRFSCVHQDIRLLREGAAIAVGDVRGTRLPEIVFGGRLAASNDGMLYMLDNEGHELASVRTPGCHPQAIALVDMDDDLIQGSDALEMAILLRGDSSPFLWVLDGNLEPLNEAWSEPVRIERPPEDLYPDQWFQGNSNRVAAADIDGDLIPELVVDGMNSIHVFARDGKELFHRLGLALPGMIALGDITGDRRHDIVCNGLFGNTWGWDSEGCEVPGMPLPLDYRFGNVNPCIVDLDGDGFNELAILGITVNSSKLWVYATAGQGRALWPQQGGNEEGTNAVSVRRGDANSDRAFDIGDAIYLLQYLFARGPGILTLKSGDFNDDNQINIADPVAILDRLFGRPT